MVADDPRSERTELPVLRDYEDLTGTDGRPLAEQLVEVYTANTRTTVAELAARVAGATGADPAAARVAHRLKGAAEAVGARFTADACERLEQDLVAGRLDEARRDMAALVDDLPHAFDRLNHALATLAAARG